MTAGKMLVADGSCWPARPCFFVAPDKLAFAARAGSDRLDVVVVRFPDHLDHLPEASPGVSEAALAKTLGARLMKANSGTDDIGQPQRFAGLE